MQVERISSLINIRNYLQNILHDGFSTVKKENINKLGSLISAMDEVIVNSCMQIDFEQLKSQKDNK